MSLDRPQANRYSKTNRPTFNNLGSDSRPQFTDGFLLWANGAATVLYPDIAIRERTDGPMYQPKTYAAQSLYCAAAMLAAGVPFVGLQDGDGGRVRFVFDNDSDRARQTAQAYTARTMQPPPQPAQVIDALFRLRDEMRQHGGR